MNEENLQTPVKTGTETQQPENQETPREETQDEQQARSQGWVSKEEWTGEPDKWRPAKEFNERGELFGKIDSMGRELKETKKALKMLQEHHTKVKDAEYTRAVNELKALQKKHLEEGNSDGYLETSELLTDLKAEQKAREVVIQNTPQQENPAFTDWKAKNVWYNSNQEMRMYADAIGLGYAQTNPDLEPEEVLTYVSKQVRGRFPERFINPNRQKPSAVEGSNTGQPHKETFQLTEDEKKVMHTFIRSGVLSKEQYIEEVKKLRGAK